MPVSEPIQGWSTQAGSDLPDGSALGLGILNTVVKQSVMRFATAAARNTAIPVGDRKAGMLCWLTSTARFECVRVDGGSWERLAPEDLFTGTEAAIKGISPPAGTPRIVQRFSGVSTTSGAGGLSVGFPTAFPNGITSLLAAPGDNANNLGFVTTILANVSLSAWNGIAYQPGGAVVANLPVRVEFQATGW